MKTLVYQGRTLLCPLSDHFRRHTDEEREAMRESVATRGVLQPVRTYTDTDLGGADALLDGEGRVTVAASLAAPVEFLHMGAMTTDEAFQVAKVFNDHRRHEDPAVVRRRRLERVAAARAGGKSIRVIADEEGVSKTQVERDLAHLELSLPGTVEPEKVVGRDGRARPARVPPRAVEDGRQAAGPGASPATAPPVARRDTPGGRRKPRTQSVADVAAALTALARRLTIFISTTPEGEKFKKYLCETGHAAWLDTRDVTVRLADGTVKTFPCRWRAFSAIRWYLRVADSPGVLSPSQIREAYRAAQGAEAGDDWRGDGP